MSFLTDGGVTNNAPAAKTERTGFLHLPNELRNRIYEDALFDHDRRAVFLPRTLPRKVWHDGHKLNDVFFDLRDPKIHKDFRLVVSSIEDERLQNTHNDCTWYEAFRLPEEIPLPIYTEDETDDEAPAPSRYRLGLDNWSVRWINTREKAMEREHELDTADVCEFCWKVDCTCIDDESSDGSEQDEEEGAELPSTDEESERSVLLPGMDKETERSEHDEEGNFSNTEHEQPTNGKEESESYDDEGYLIPPRACFKTHGAFGLAGRDCRFCGGCGLREDQDEEAYVDSDSDDEDPFADDDEHFDSEEWMGMVFRTTEPGILLTCKEIREQCLPLYYSLNAFSWRSFWLDQRRSIDRFNEWTRVVGQYSKYITQLSFEGRHLVEEGIEFEVDIDLLAVPPYFDVAVDCIHPGDELTDSIVEAIEQDYVVQLWKLSQREGGKIVLGPEDVFRLGALFVEQMQRDPGVVGDRGQWDHGLQNPVPRH